MALTRTVTLLTAASLLLSGCGTYEAVRGGVSGPPSQAKPPQQAAQAPEQKEARWVLVKNVRHGATMGEPEYVWVEEDKIPGSLTTLLFGKSAALAPRDVVAKYGPPPRNGKISPAQGGPPVAAPAPSRGVASLRPAAPRVGGAGPTPDGPLLPEVTPRGYIVHIDTRVIVVDLTSLEGVKKGSLLSIRRERLPLTHPVTGEYLGELDEEIGTARVVELRERFTVAEIEELRPGVELKIKDRVIVKQQ